MFKKGVSPVIATVLLIVITLVAVSLVAVFVVPFVDKNLKGSKDCFAVMDDIKLTDVGYTCSNAAFKGGRTGFSVQINDDDIVGFKAILFKEGIANSYTIENGSNLTNIRMLSKNFPIGLETPSTGGVRTYVAIGAYNKVEVNPILRDGRVCDAKESIEVTKCSDPVIIEEITEY